MGIKAKTAIVLSALGTVFFIVFFLGVSIYILIKHNSDTALSKRLLGKWDCVVEVKEEGITSRINIENTFVRNGRYNAFGVLSLDTPLESVLASVVSGQEARIITNILSDTFSLDYWVSETGEWEVHKGMLILTATDTKINRNTYSEMNIYAALQAGFSKSKTKIIAQQIHGYAKYLNEAFMAMLPQGISDASEIVVHSETAWSFISESEGSETLCSRVTNAPVD